MSVASDDEAEEEAEATKKKPGDAVVRPDHADDGVHGKEKAFGLLLL